MTQRLWLAGVIALAAGLLAPQAGQAGFQVKLSQASFSDVVVTDLDGTPASESAITTDQNGLKNRIGFQNGGTFGTFVFNGDSGATSNAPGTASTARTFGSALELTNTSGSEQTLVITVSDDGFSAPGAANELLFLNNRLTYLDGSGTVTSVATASPSLATTDPISLSTSGILNSPTANFLRTGSTFTLTTTLTVTLNAGGTINFQSLAQITPAPAPATAVMLLAAAPVLGLARRLRRGNVGAPLAM